MSITNNDYAELNAILAAVAAGPIMSSQKMKVLLEESRKLLSCKKKLLDLIPRNSYCDIIKAAEEGSTIVYFKSAQLFKIYKKEELEKLTDDELVKQYENFNQSYEIVIKKAKQKIVFFGETSLLNCIDIVTDYMVKYMQSKGVLNFTIESIMCYKNKEDIEFVLNDYYVDNSDERDFIVNELLEFITKYEKNTNISRKLSVLKYSEFEGSNMVEMPFEKELLIGTASFKNRLVSYIKDCSRLYRDHNLMLRKNEIHDSLKTINLAYFNNVYEQHDTHYETILEKNKNRVSKWVYFIKEGTHNKIKIGNTIELENRCKTLQTGNSNMLKIIGYIETTDHVTLERRFHKYFHKYKVLGEWFNLTVSDVMEVLKKYRACKTMLD